MKQFISAVAFSLFAAAPIASTAGTTITIDFERAWDYDNGDVLNYYNGGKAAVGSQTGPNLGVVFANISGFNEDPLGAGYSGAPTPLGVAYAEGPNAIINVPSGKMGFSFFYSSPIAVIGAVKAYSGLNGTGTLLASLDLLANEPMVGVYDTFTFASLALKGLARSFDLSNLASGDTTALFDNVALIPEPGTLVLLVTGGALALARRRSVRR